MKTSLLWFSAAALLVVGAAAFPSTQSRAEIDYPWCAHSAGAEGGGAFCRYTTLDQCRASLVNGWCERNARVVWREQQMQAAPRSAR